MDFNTTIGVVVICGALGLLIVLVWLSQRTINRIDRIGPQSARMIAQQLAPNGTDAETGKESVATEDDSREDVGDE